MFLKLIFVGFTVCLKLKTLKIIRNVLNEISWNYSAKQSSLFLKVWWPLGAKFKVTRKLGFTNVNFEFKMMFAYDF